MPSTAPGWFRVAAIILLIWNLIGVCFFISQWMMTGDDIAKLPLTQQFLWTHMTARVWVAYAAAVGAGALASIGLLLRKRCALPLFVVTLVALFVQFTNPTLLHVAATQGYGIMGFPIFLIVVGFGQLWLARLSRVRGWLE
jgi:hypothetical protein